MGVPDGGDHADVGSRHLAQRADLAEATHAHSSTAADGVGRVEDRHRQTLLVVETPDVGRRAEMRCADRGNQVLGGRLADTAGDTDHGGGEASAGPLRERHEVIEVSATSIAVPSRRNWSGSLVRWATAPEPGPDR